jgi:hypothetical protein
MQTSALEEQPVLSDVSTVCTDTADARQWATMDRSTQSVRCSPERDSAFEEVGCRYLSPPRVLFGPDHDMAAAAHGGAEQILVLGIGVLEGSNST